MALVNVAVDLAQRGRRVLIVDFDLEAPGLDTFPVLSLNAPARGLVDYVHEYLESDQAPDVSDFVALAPTFENLFVMPSGAKGKGYASSFGVIDWAALYEEHDGYLLFEDLKEQWRGTIRPDYVLIDSRTGYTDIGGICTRQLPDAVTVLFFPNEQNLRGLTRVVADIRAEARPPREKQIALQFVMSNVPDLDDEDDILVEMKERFQRDLKFEEEPQVVHRYDSLSLLNQAVFSKDRPNSRLAKEYSAVADKIVGGNLADRDGAIHHIQEAQKKLRRSRVGRRPSGSSDLAEQLKDIKRLHAADGEILFRLGTLSARVLPSDSESYLDDAIESGYRKPEAFLERARVRLDGGDPEGASEDALSVLEFEGLPAGIVMEATRLATFGEARGLDTLAAVTGLDTDDQMGVATMLSRVGELDHSKAILQRLCEDRSQPDESRSSIRSELALNYIASGEFRDAIDILTHGGRDVDEMCIQDAFNFGMAIWGRTGQIARAPFERVLICENTAEREGPNFLQCLAVAHWAAGDSEAAREFACRARHEAQSSRMIFSCWQYHTVSRSEFVEDVDDMIALIEGDETRLPKFMVAVYGGTATEQ